MDLDSRLSRIQETNLKSPIHNQPSKQTQMHLPPEIMNSLKNKKANPQTGIRETRRVSLFLKSGVAPDSIEMIQSKKIAEANKMVDAGQGHVVGHRVIGVIMVKVFWMAKQKFF